MTDLKETLRGIAAAIVDDPDKVTVLTENETEREVDLVLSVAPDDMGMVIGKGGKIAKAIRTVMKAAAAVDNRRVNVEIRDYE